MAALANKGTQLESESSRVPFFVLRSTKVARTGSKADRTEAERVAAKWESELREGRYRNASKITWDEFRLKYEAEVLPSLAAATDTKISGVFNAVEKYLSPGLQRSVTAERLSYLQSKLREAGRADNTIKSCMAHLVASIRWAVGVGLLHAAPKVQMPKPAKGAKMMKGRPITGEEFDHMLAKCEAVVGAERAASWQHYLRGLYCSGLRLAESLELCWDQDNRLCVDLSGKRPMLRIPAALEKGNQDRLLPMAPEFAEFLAATPEADRTGYVFKPEAARVHGERLGALRVCQIVSKIGEKAGVKVATDPKGKIKYASAHDLRRSFGERWASRVMPQVLMELMRHESIDTTLKFYVGRNAQTTADVLWAAHEKAAGNIFGNSGPKEPVTPSDESHAKPCDDSTSKAPRKQPSSKRVSVRLPTPRRLPSFTGKPSEIDSRLLISSINVQKTRENGTRMRNHRRTACLLRCAQPRSIKPTRANLPSSFICIRRSRLVEMIWSTSRLPIGRSAQATRPSPLRTGSPRRMQVF